eukprot:759627-Hanusia_phi.AAC.2
MKEITWARRLGGVKKRMIEEEQRRGHQGKGGKCLIPWKHRLNGLKVQVETRMNHLVELLHKSLVHSRTGEQKRDSKEEEDSRAKPGSKHSLV